MRGVVSAGMTAALERLELTPCFDVVVGASAGAINGAAFLAGAAQRGAAAYWGPLASRSFVSPMKVVRRKPVIDVKQILDLAAGLDAAGHERVISSGAELHCVAVDVETARTDTLSGMRTRGGAVDRAARLVADAMGGRGARHDRRAALPRRRDGLADPGAGGARRGRHARARAADAPVGRAAPQRHPRRRLVHRAPPGPAEPGARGHVPATGRRVRAAGGGHRAPLGPGGRGAAARPRHPAGGRARRAWASSNGARPCWPRRRPTPSASSRRRSAPARGCGPRPQRD